VLPAATTHCLTDRRTAVVGGVCAGGAILGVTGGCWSQLRRRLAEPRAVPA